MPKMKSVLESHQLAPLQSQINEFNQILSCIRQTVPFELAYGCQAVAWLGTTLLIAVPSNAIASRLRMMTPQLLAALHQRGWPANAIEPRIQVGLQRAKSAKSLSIPQSALFSFSDLAPKINDLALREAILRLVDQHLKKKKNGRF